MKLGTLSKSHIVLAGAIVAIMALAVYMWLDMRNLERSQKPEAEPASQAQTPLEGNAALAAQAETGNVSSAVDREELIDKKSSPRKNRIDQQELAEASAKFFRRQARASKAGSASAGSTDDWMFKIGENVEAEPVEDSRDKSTIE